MEINAELINLYNAFLSKKINFYKEDYDATEKALKDRRIGYITRIEYKDDLREDLSKISRLSSLKSSLICCARSKNIQVNEFSKDKLKEINTSNVNELMIKELLDSFMKNEENSEKILLKK